MANHFQKRKLSCAKTHHLPNPQSSIVLEDHSFSFCVSPELCPRADTVLMGLSKVGTALSKGNGQAGQI